MRKKWIKTACAAFMTAALTLSFGTAAFASDEVSGLLDSLTALEEGDLSTASMPTVTAEVTVSGNIQAESVGDMSIDAKITTVSDAAANQHSVSGYVSASGISVNFGGYFDQDQIMVQIPGLPKILTYDYKADPASTLLGQAVGVETLGAINKYLELIANSGNLEAAQKMGEDLIACFQNAAGKLMFGQADAKECIVGGETKMCEGMKALITKDAVAGFLNDFLAVSLPNGQTMEEYMNMIASLADSATYGSSTTDIVGQLQQAVESFPEMTASVYTDAGTPVEIDLEAEGSVLSLQFRGAEIPYTDTYLVADGEVVGCVIAEINGSTVTANVYAGDKGTMNVATCTVNIETGEYSISTPYLPSDITGQFTVDGDAVVVTANFMGLNISIRTFEGGEVVKPEGETLELTQMTEEDLESLGTSLASAFPQLAA